MTSLIVTFGRAGDDLVITNAPGLGFWLPEDGIGQIVRALRRTYAPDSAYIPGKVLLAAVEEASAVPLAIYAQASTAVGLQALRDELEAAATQWAYDLTLNINGVARTYNAEMEIPVWAAFDAPMADVHLDRCQLVIPVNP